MRRLIIGLATAMFFANLSLVEGAVVFSESFTGAELNSDSRVSFPGRQPTLNGSSLYFDTGTIELYEKLFVLSLLPANTLSSYDPVVIEFCMNLTVQRSDWPTYPTDHDPGAFVGDGEVLIGFLAADNFGGTIVPQVHRDEGTHGIATDGLDLLKNAGYPDIGQSFDVHGKITLLPDSTEVYASFLNGAASHVFPVAIDRGKPLNFTFLAQDSNERYQMNSLSIEVSGTPIPEPASIAVWSVLALAGIGFRCCRRRR